MIRLPGLRIATALVAIAGGSLFAVTANATSVTLTTIADGQTGQNVSGQLPTEPGLTAIGISQSGSLIRNGVFEFDLSAIPDTATIDAASFNWVNSRFISNIGGNPAQVDLFAFNGDGVVTDTDHTGGTQVADTSVALAGVGSGVVSGVGLTDLAPLAAALPGDFLTIRFETDSFASIQVAGLLNADFGAASLSVDFTETTIAPPVPPIPVPAGLPLLFAGLGGLVLVKSRRNAP